MLLNAAFSMGAMALRMQMEKSVNPALAKETYIGSVINNLVQVADQRHASYRDSVGDNPIDYLFDDYQPPVSTVRDNLDRQIGEVDEFLRAMLMATTDNQTDGQGTNADAGH